MKTFGIIIKKKNKADKEGYLHLRITENRKSITKSLNIKIKETYWNPAAGRVKATDKIDYKLINRQLEEILEAAENEDRLIEKKVVDNAKEIESNVIDDTGKDGFLSFFTQQINEISNVGTKKKFRTYLYGFEEYLKSIKKADIAFKDIDKTFVNNLNNYLLNTRKPSTVNRYMKQYKSVLKDAIAEEKVFYKYHPFAKMTFPDPEVKEKYLTKEEVQQLLEFNSTNKVLIDTRNKFLFSIFAQGMRVSDILTIRFESYNKEEFYYQMFKTNKSLSFKITRTLAIIIADILIDHHLAIELKEYKAFKQHYDEYKDYLTELTVNKPAQIPLKTLKKWSKVKDSEGIQEKIKEQNIASDEQLKYYGMKLEEATHKLLSALSLTYPKQFIFKELDITKYDKLNLKQQYNQIQSRTTIFNKNLKKLQKALELTTTLTTHLARHTYASLMLMEAKADVYTISKSLNHKNLAITERYMKRFDKDKVNEANSKMDEIF